ncbi:MAG: hypothetical protein ACTIIZ_10090 [Levilactobacillus brevis]
MKQPHLLRGLWQLNQRLSQRRMMQAITAALRLVYPFVLVMTFIDVIGQGFLMKTGFFYQIYHIGHWLPGITIWQQGFTALGLVINGVVAVMIAFATGYYLARSYHGDALTVGIMSALAFLTLNLNYGALGAAHAGVSGVPPFVTTNLGPQGIFLAIVIGLTVGWLAI